VYAVNGSGRAPAASSIEKVKSSLAKDNSNSENMEDLRQKFRLSVHAITVPGAARYVAQKFFLFSILCIIHFNICNVTLFDQSVNIVNVIEAGKIFI